MDSRFRGNDAQRNCALSSATLGWILESRAVRHDGALIENYRISDDSLCLGKRSIIAVPLSHVGERGTDARDL